MVVNVVVVNKYIYYFSNQKDIFIKFGIGKNSIDTFLLNTFKYIAMDRSQVKVKKSMGLLDNKFVFYFVSVVGIGSLINFCYTMDIMSIGLFTATVCIASLFTQNMTAILLISIVVSSIFKNSTIEGFKKKGGGKGKSVKKMAKKATKVAKKAGKKAAKKAGNKAGKKAAKKAGMKKIKEDAEKAEGELDEEIDKEFNDDGDDDEEAADELADLFGNND